jgi:hypothetical protein
VITVADNREVGKDWKIPAKSFVKEDMFGRATKPFLAANDVGNSHKMIVHDDTEMIGRVAIGLDDDLVIDPGVLPGDVTTNSVCAGSSARTRNFEPENMSLTTGNSLLAFRWI